MVTTRKPTARVTSTSHRRPPQDPESPVKKFCTFVLPSTMKYNMMMIPPKFVKLHGSKLSDVVTLETPMGFKRSIKLKWSGKEIWFDKGWTEFAQAHLIQEGYFLLFEYKETSSFKVIIFNVLASEIKYPLDAVKISDSDDEVIDVTDKVFLGDQSTSEHQPEKRARDIEFDKILYELDVISSVQVLKETEKDERTFKG